MPAPSLNAEQIRRYARHILLPDIGGVGQKRLLEASVLVEVGSADAIVALAYLAAAGVGCLILADAGAGVVTEREAALGILYGAGDVGRPRIDAIAERVRHINPDVRVEPAGAAARPLGSSVSLAQAPALDRDAEPWLASEHPDEELATALVRGGVRAVLTLTKLLSPEPA